MSATGRWCEACVPLNWAQIPAEHQKCPGCGQWFCGQHLPDPVAEQARYLVAIVTGTPVSLANLGHTCGGRC